MRRILTRQDYLKDINSKHYSKYTGINEAAFANDANWGDTLVGRLINSLARKAKISFNQSRMSRLVKQLKEYFDMMLETGKFDITDSTVFTFIEISNIIGILKKQVEDGEEVSVLIQTTENLIIKVDSYDFDNKDEMIRLLKEFLEYLKGLEKDGASDNDSESGEESGDSNAIFLKYSKNFLQSVVDLHNMIKDNVVRIGGGKESYDNKVISAKSKLKVGNEYMYINTEGVSKRCLLLSKTNVVTKEKDKKWLTEDDREGESLDKDQVFVVYKNDKDSYNKTGSGNSVEVLKIYNLDGKAPDSKVEKPGEDVSTSFNKEKYLNLEKIYQSGKKLDVLKNLIKMGQNAVKVHQAKNDQQSVKFYTDKLNKQVLDLVKKQAQSYGISLQIEKEVKVGDKSIKKPTGKFKDAKALKEEIAKVSKQKWSVDLPFGKSTGVKSSEKSPTLTVGETEKQNASYYFLYEELEANLQKDEVQAKNAWKKVVKAYNDSGVSKFIPQIEELLSIGTKDGKEKLLQSKKDIVSICKQVVLNKSTTGKPITFDELIKEAVNVNDMSKSISLFGRILLSFKEDMGLTGSYGSAIKPLKEFINKFSELEKLLPNLSKKNEMISNYSRFLLIRERNEFSDQIKNKFDELFTEDVIKYFEITEERRSEIESSVQEPEGYDFIFDSADYIIEIVRAFNRAYRIHTPGTIPSGRTKGKVSNKVFREYEYLGSGTGGSADDPGAGPYRNKELFTTWSEGVNDILSDTKYRPLFSDKAIFRFSQGGDDVKKGGKILMSFITRLLNDQEMYRGAVMSKFLNEYFGISEDFSDKKGLETRKNDSKKNSETAGGIEITKLEILPIDKTSLQKLEKALIDSNKELKFKFKIKDGDKEKTYYSIFKEKRNNGDIICILTSKNFPFGTKISIEENRETPENPVFVNFRISGGKITGKFLKFEDSRNVSSNVKDINWTFSDSDVGILCDDRKEPYLDEVDINSKFRDFKEQYEKIKSRI